MPPKTKSQILKEYCEKHGVPFEELPLHELVLRNLFLAVLVAHAKEGSFEDILAAHVSQQPFHPYWHHDEDFGAFMTAALEPLKPEDFQQ